MDFTYLNKIEHPDGISNYYFEDSNGAVWLHSLLGSDFVTEDERIEHARNEIIAVYNG